MTNKIEPHKHHYIPQFILRKFCDDNGQVYYWDIKTQKLSKRNPKSIFMNIDMYRDEKNHEENPTDIENLLSKFEQEIASLLSNKFIDKNEIIITRKELEKLRIYLSLQAFRDDYRKQQYVDKNFSKTTEMILAKYANDNDYEDLWKREVELLSSCRSKRDIENCKGLDDIIKTDFIIDTEGYYMTVVDTRGGDMLISDVYPTLSIYPTSESTAIHTHKLFPISNSRILILNHIMFKPELKNDVFFNHIVKSSEIGGNMIIPPTNKYKKYPQYTEDDEYIYKVRKIYQEDVNYLNALILNEARKGIMFKNPERILESVIEYNERNDTKQKYYALVDELEKIM